MQRQDKWADLQWTLSKEGNPVLDGTLDWLTTAPGAEHDAGHHVVVLDESSNSERARTTPSPILGTQIAPTHERTTAVGGFRRL